MSVDVDDLHATISRVLSPSNFFLAAPLRLRCEWSCNESIRWEIYRGTLVSPALTREEREFRSWNIYLDDPAAADQPADQALISVKLDAVDDRLHVTRSILTFVWEAFEESPRVISTREIVSWIPELVGSVRLEQIATSDQLESELRRWVGSAVYGTSRLPITSVESPLPQFSLGQLAYFPTTSAETCTDGLDDTRTLCSTRWPANMDVGDQARLLETVLRATLPADADTLADGIWNRWQELEKTPADILLLLRTLFNQLALSPYTRFADNLVNALRHWSGRGPVELEMVIDALSYMLRHLVRHLTAYDLVEFHNRGANYPDALLLDLLLKTYLALIQQQTQLFTANTCGHRLRRRALRQACIMRGLLEGLPVPDEPTSPGENSRVLPAPHTRIPEHQLGEPGRRQLRLYAGDPTAELLDDATLRVFAQCLSELHLAVELRELGTAVFLDRPLGIGRPPGQPDRSPLLSYEAFSRQIAERRLANLSKSIGAAANVGIPDLTARLMELPQRGMAVADVVGPRRQGVVALADATRVAEDFRLLRTTTSSLHGMFADYHMEPLRSAAPDTAAWLMQAQQVLLIRRPGSSDELELLDEELRCRILIQLSVDGSSPDYIDLPGGEVLAHGIQLNCDENGARVNIVLRPLAVPNGGR